MNLGQADLRQFFHPRSIAIVGVPRRDYQFGGHSFLKKIQESRFQGNLYPINPKADEIRGVKTYPNLASLPETPDLALVCVAADQVPAVLEECARIGLRHIHILASGFKEMGTKRGRELEARITHIAGENGLLVMGPNCMGSYCPSSGLTPWGAIPGRSGPLGIIGQSGGITQRLTEYTYSLGIGVEKAVSFGNASVLNSLDFLEFMARDDGIRVIAMYLESVRDGDKFLRLAREVSRKKPIVLWKGGETEVGAATVASHTGALAGEQMLWEAFYRQTGVIHVRSLDECVDAILALCLVPAPQGKGVFLIGGGGGYSVSYSDTCVQEGLDVPLLSETTMAWLGQNVPAAGCILGNPLDVWRSFFDAPFLDELLDLAYDDPAVAMIIVDRMISRKAFHVPDMPDPNPETIEFIKDRGHPKPTVFTVESEGGDPDLSAKGVELRARFCRAGIPAYPSLQRAARALVHLHRYHARFGR